MRYEHLNPPDDLTPEGFPPGFPGAPDPQPVPDGREPVTDREVPLPGAQAMTLVHQWLDGETTAAMVRAVPGGNEATDLWSRINDEAELLRNRTTPLYVHRRIMEALPDDRYQVHHRWHQRTIPLTPVTLLTAALALLGLGALVARVAAR